MGSARTVKAIGVVWSQHLAASVSLPMHKIGN
jgi:hypothetical protein